MTDTNAGRRMRCGNDPRVPLAPGDREAVDDFKAWLHAKAGGVLGDILLRAAQLLLDRADAAQEDLDTNPYWHSQIEPPERWFANGIDNACGGAGGLLAGLMSPPAARALAEWLRQAGRRADAVPYEAFLVARRLLDEQP